MFFILNWTWFRYKNWHQIAKDASLSCPFPLNFFFLTFTFTRSSWRNFVALKKENNFLFFNFDFVPTERKKNSTNKPEKLLAFEEEKNIEI